MTTISGFLRASLAAGGFAVSVAPFMIALMIYGMFAYALIYVFFVLLAALIVWLTPYFDHVPKGADILVLILLSINSVLILGNIAATFVIFLIIGPIRISREVSALETLDAPTLVASSKAAALIAGVTPFDSIIPASKYYIGVLKSGVKRVLCIDPVIEKHLTPDELTSLLVHEYGHLQPGRSVCYNFLRRADIASRFISIELNDPAASTTYRRITNGLTLFFPPILKSGSRAISFHIGRVLCIFYKAWLNMLFWIFRREFHAAEFNADAMAARNERQLFERALIKISILQCAAGCRAVGMNSTDEIVNVWWNSYTEETSTHPSLVSRIKKLSPNFEPNGQELIELASQCALPTPVSVVPIGSAGLLQSLCFGEFVVLGRNLRSQRALG